ncbi:MAG: hypothetical protein N2747_06365 [Chitinophagaceae bacterium]|nr:hypothetical protein [Chitinophagaceae bacterium]
MKNKDYHIEEILNSIEGIRRASAPEFFYTRLKARMEKEVQGVYAMPGLLKPVFVLGMLAVVIFINAFVIFNKTSASDELHLAGNDTDLIQLYASEYTPAEIGNLYDLNIEK